MQKYLTAHFAFLYLIIVKSNIITILINRMAKHLKRGQFGLTGKITTLSEPQLVKCNDTPKKIQSILD